MSQVLGRLVEQQQRLVLAHRINTIGRLRGGAVTWTYRPGQERLIKRPDDGCLAKPWRVRCEDCRKELEFRVYSAGATRRRQARRRAWARVGWATLVGSVIGYVLTGSGARPFFIASCLIGAYVGYLAGGLAGREVGISGHGVSMPSVAAHTVRLIETRPPEYPELVCQRCGHREDYQWQSFYRTGYRDKQYLAASKRMQAHRCRGAAGPRQGSPTGRAPGTG